MAPSTTPQRLTGKKRPHSVGPSPTKLDADALEATPTSVAKAARVETPRSGKQAATPPAKGAATPQSEKNDRGGASATPDANGSAAPTTAPCKLFSFAEAEAAEAKLKDELDVGEPDDYPDDGGDFGEAAWRGGLEQLQRLDAERRATEQKEPEPNRLTEQNDIVALIRRATRAEVPSTDAEWAPLTKEMNYMSTKMNGVLGRLKDHEIAAALEACSTRYESHPMERTVCAMWITKILRQRGDLLRSGPQDLRQRLRPLLRHLEVRFGSAPEDALGRRSRACLGKWRLVAALATAGRTAHEAQEEESGEDEGAGDGGEDEADEQEQAGTSDEDADA